MTTTCITLAEYQSRTADTQTEAAKSPDYLRFGLLAECGEVAGAYAKMIRDHGGQLTDAARELFKSELGDVFWFGAREDDRLGVKWEDKTYTELANKSECDTSLADLPDLITELVANACDYVRCGSSWSRGMVFVCAGTITKCVGLTVDEVLQANLEKLADRKRRGVISGSGDKR